MDGTKKWYQSKGVIGGLISTICVGLLLAGKTVSVEDQSLLTNEIVVVVEAVVGLVAAVVGVIGRLKAKKTVVR